MSNKEIECLHCYELFEIRKEYPDFQVCEKCAKKPSDLSYCCPKCGWSCESITHDEDAPVKISNQFSDYEFGYCGGRHWTETWTCPVCETIFEIDNSNV